jgi:hypothetical protein
MPRRKVRKPHRKQIVEQVLTEFRVPAREFFSRRRDKNTVAARRAAIQRLHADGACHTEIVELIGRGPDLHIVRYHLGEYTCSIKRIKNAERYQKIKADPIAYEAFLARKRLNPNIKTNRGRKVGFKARDQHV